MASTLSTGEEAQLAQTIEMFEVITQSQPNDYQSLEILKEAYTKLGREKDLISTSKRIAQAYVQMGQLSSAILEYETVLQRHPNDPDVKAALEEIESQSNAFSFDPAPDTSQAQSKPTPDTSTIVKPGETKAPQSDFDDGCRTMRKLLVDSKAITSGDFDLCWSSPNMQETPVRAIEPFIQTLADKGILPIEKCLALLCDKTRMGYLPLGQYEIDIDLSRSFPAATCRRWCILPFDKMSKSIMVATANPFNQQAAKELASATQQRLLWYLAPPADIMASLGKAFR
jgi:hypothetical protein